jgi:hypothetical protein
MSTFERFGYADLKGLVFSHIVEKHGSHNQKTHGGKGGGSGEQSFNTLDDFYTFVSGTQNYEELEKLSISQNPEYGQDAVTEYVNNSAGINSALRADEEFAQERYGKTIFQLDETMVRTDNITRPLTVYRGVRGGDSMPPEFEELEVGDVYFDSAFTSTSLSPTSALGFAGIYNDEATQGIVLEIAVPANSEGIFPNSWLGLGGSSPSSNNFASELEFLLPRNSGFKVISNEGKVWKVEVVDGQR